MAENGMALAAIQEVGRINKIFLGMLLIFLNLNIDIGASRIGLIPTFVGYIMMRKGLKELGEYSEKFVQIMPIVSGMIFYSFICYIFDILGFSGQIGLPLSFVLGLISTIFSLLISYRIIMGIKDIELAQGEDLNSQRLHATWKLLAFFSLISCMLIFVSFLAIISITVSFFISICYLLVFNESKNRFYQMEVNQ